MNAETVSLGLAIHDVWKQKAGMEGPPDVKWALISAQHAINALTDRENRRENG